MLAQCSSFASRSLFSVRNVCQRSLPRPSSSLSWPARMYSSSSSTITRPSLSNSAAGHNPQLNRTIELLSEQTQKEQQAFQTVEQLWAAQSKAALAAAARTPPAGPYSGIYLRGVRT